MPEVAHREGSGRGDEAAKEWGEAAQGMLDEAEANVKALKASVTNS